MLLCDELYKNWQIKRLAMTTVCDKLLYMCMHNINMPHAALNFNLINGSVAVDKGERVSSWVINYLLNNTPILFVCIFILGLLRYHDCIYDNIKKETHNSIV